MICPKCKAEYQEGYTWCEDCAENLIKDETPEVSKSGGWFSKFGVTTAQNAICALFFIGLFPMAYSSVVFGKYIYLTSMISRETSYKQDGTTFYSLGLVNNSTYGIFAGIAVFIIGMLIWKVFCELFIIVFRAIETYINKNSN